MTIQIDTLRRTLLGAIAGCAASPFIFAQNQNAVNDLIVVLPGIMGSVLAKERKEVWAPTYGSIGRSLVTLGDSIGSLKLSEDPSSIYQDDGVRATRLVDDFHVLPGLWKIDGYDLLLRALLSLPKVENGKNFFVFPYDWRQDNRVSAKFLEAEVNKRLINWRKISGNDGAKALLVAHSMGGLIARYYIECLDGWRFTRKLITFGTPFQGSLKALRFLTEGTGIKYLQGLTALVRSFPSVYQLLPTYPCVSSGDVIQSLQDIKLQGLNHVQVSAASSFHKEIKDAVRKNSTNMEYKKSGFGIRPIVGVGQETLQWANNVGNSLSFTTTHPSSDVSGDGTVPAPSAVPEQQFGLDSEFFVSSSHGSIQKANQVLTHVAQQIKAAEVNWRIFTTRAGDSFPLTSISVPDAVISGSAIPISFKYDPEQFHDRMALQIKTPDGNPIVSYEVIGKEGTASTFAKPLNSGVYSLQVTFTKRSLESVTISDSVCVLPRGG